MPSDLKLLDELLLEYMRFRRMQPVDLEEYSIATREAIHRLREAYASGEMQTITLTWANYFNGAT